MLGKLHANQLDKDQDYWPEEAEQVYENIEKDYNNTEEKVLKLNEYLDFTAHRLDLLTLELFSLNYETEADELQDGHRVLVDSCSSVDISSIGLHEPLSDHDDGVRNLKLSIHRVYNHYGVNTICYKTL